MLMVTPGDEPSSNIHQTSHRQHAARDNADLSGEPFTRATPTPGHESGWQDLYSLLGFGRTDYLSNSLEIVKKN